MTLQALIFDVDGTLADTEDAHRRAFNAAFADAGLSWFWSERLYTFLLSVAGGKERLDFFISHLDAPQHERDAFRPRIPAIHASKTEHYGAFVQRGDVVLRPGIAELIREARGEGLKLAVASATSRSNVDALTRATLGQAASETFDVIVCGDQASRKKPSPDIYHLALSELGAAPEACVAFEDSPAGLKAARAAGLCAIVSPTRWTANGDFSGACAVAGEFQDLGGLRAVRVLHEKSLSNRTEAA